MKNSLSQDTEESAKNANDIEESRPIMHSPTARSILAVTSGEKQSNRGYEDISANGRRGRVGKVSYLPNGPFTSKAWKFSATRYCAQKCSASVGATCKMADTQWATLIYSKNF